MAKRGQAKVRTTVADCRAAALWLSSHVRSKPQGTILTGPPDTRDWVRLANLLAVKGYRRRPPGPFVLPLDRVLLIEFQRAYPPSRLYNVFVRCL